MNFQRSEHILLKNVQTSEHFCPESVQSCEQILVEMRIIGENSAKTKRMILCLC